MCARRFLFVILTLTLLAVAGAFAIFQFGQSVLIKSATPVGHYRAPPAASGPDYSKPDSWIARPEIVDNPSNWEPQDAGGIPAYIAQTATFYVHPTTYLSTAQWNAPLSPGGETEARTRLFVQSEASPFNFNSDIWAPRYRQAAYGAFLLDNKDAQRALDLAYTDVRSAFDTFLAAQPKDRPIVLAAHSQGALHLIRLLRERGSSLKGRLVAAYIVGWPISTTADLPALGFPACKSQEQAGCILSWMTFGEPPNPDLMLDEWEKTKGLNGGTRRRNDILCVNPLTGTQNGDSGQVASHGTLVPTSDFQSGRLVAGTVSARCKQGLLILGGDIPNLGPFVLPGNNYHVYDYALFWEDIREDYIMRTAANWSPL